MQTEVVFNESSVFTVAFSGGAMAEETRYSPEEAVRGLAAAILTQAIEDVRAAQAGQVRRDWMQPEGLELSQQNRRARVRELHEFFTTEHFKMLCEMVDLDARTVRERVGI